MRIFQRCVHLICMSECLKLIDSLAECISVSPTSMRRTVWLNSIQLKWFMVYFEYLKLPVLTGNLPLLKPLLTPWRQEITNTLSRSWVLSLKIFRCLNEAESNELKVRVQCERLQRTFWRMADATERKEWATLMDPPWVTSSDSTCRPLVSDKPMKRFQNNSVSLSIDKWRTFFSQCEIWMECQRNLHGILVKCPVNEIWILGNLQQSLKLNVSYSLKRTV